MSVITKLSIDTTLMSNLETVRQLTIRGKVGAKFTIIALQDGTLKYYNFEDNTFDLGHAPKSNLNVTMTSSTFHTSIVFPSGGGTYVIKLLTHEGTRVTGGYTVLSKNIEKQSSQATITFSPATTNTSNYQTFTTTTSTGAVSDSAKIDFEWTINNASDDTGGFGLKIHDDLGGSDFLGAIAHDLFDTFWYVETDKAIVNNLNGDAQDSTKVTVADTTGLSVGMTLFYHKGSTTPVLASGAAVTNCVIQDVDETGGIIKFSKEVAFEDGETMKLRAYGAKNILYNTGMQLNFDAASVDPILLTKTVRANVTNSQTVTLTDTHGISGGLTIVYLGVGVDNSSNNRVNVVTPDCPDLTAGGALDNDGQVTVELNQTLEQGTVLTFKNTHSQVKIKFGAKIINFTEASKTIYLDLDKILTPGVSGA